MNQFIAKKNKIFKEKKGFTIKYCLPNEFTYQENDDKGEFVDKEGNVISQLMDDSSNPNGFLVAAVFMGEPTYKLIYYDRITILEIK